MSLSYKTEYASPMRLPPSLALALIVLFSPSSATATPVTLTLTRPPSSVKFGVSSPSPALQMNGSLSDFNGSLVIDDQHLSLSHVRFSMNLTSAQLPPNQVLQAVMLQTLLSRLRNERTTFESSSIEHLRDSTYLVSGSYNWLNKSRQAEIPIQLVQTSPTRTEIKVTVNGPLKNPSARPSEFSGFGAVPDKSSGWAKASLKKLSLDN